MALLAAAGFLAGGVNAVAGGGSLISFPALLAVGFPSVTANVTNAVAVLPGYLGGSLAYRKELEGQRRRVYSLALTSAAGALLGGVLLLAGSEALFEAIVPFLLLGSCALLAAQPALSRLTRPAGERSARLHAMAFAAAVYGGYFGAGLGILLLAVLALCIEEDLQRLNALKSVLSLLIAAVSVALFAFEAPIEWTAAGLMALTSLAGGHVGVGFARRLDERLLRGLVIALGVAVAAVLLTG